MHSLTTRESSRKRSNGRCRPTGGDWKITDSLLVAIYGANNTAQPRRAEWKKRSPRRRRRNNSNFCLFNSFIFPRVRQQRKWPIGHRPKTGRDISLSGEVVVVVVVGEMKTVIAKSWHKCVELYRWLCDRRSAAAIPFSFYYQDRVCILCNIHDCYYLFISLTDRRWPTKPSQPPRDNIFFFL